MQDFNIQIHHRKKTRRVTLRVLPGKVIRVTAPYRTKEDEIKKLVLKNSDWILKRHQMLESMPAPYKYQFKNGEIFRFRGQNYYLQISDGFFAITIHNNSLCVSVPNKIEDKKGYIQNRLVKWYQAQALSHIKSRVDHFTNLIGEQSRSVSLKNYKSRWGCCSAKGDLIFNWQIISFEENLLDYVVAHEVCHLKEMNHSPQFYRWLSRLGFEKNEYHRLMRAAKNLFFY